MIIESNQTELIMAVRVAHARFKYDLQKTSTEDNRGTLFIISDTPSTSKTSVKQGATILARKVQPFASN